MNAKRGIVTSTTALDSNDENNECEAEIAAALDAIELSFSDDEDSANLQPHPVAPTAAPVVPPIVALPAVSLIVAPPVVSPVALPIPAVVPAATVTIPTPGIHVDGGIGNRAGLEQPLATVRHILMFCCGYIPDLFLDHRVYPSGG